jgi:hypothetical protein
MTMAKTLAGLLRELGIKVVPISRSYGRGSRETCAGRTLEHVFRMHGYDTTRATLMTFCETMPTNRHALIAPVILGVSDVLRAYPDWFGNTWFQVFDDVDLGKLFQQASADRAAAATDRDLDLRKDAAPFPGSGARWCPAPAAAGRAGIGGSGIDEQSTRGKSRTACKVQ